MCVYKNGVLGSRAIQKFIAFVRFPIFVAYFAAKIVYSSFVVVVFVACF